MRQQQQHRHHLALEGADSTSGLDLAGGGTAGVDSTVPAAVPALSRAASSAGHSVWGTNATAATAAAAASQTESRRDQDRLRRLARARLRRVPRFGARVAELVGARVGSWSFVAAQTAVLVAWVLLNTLSARSALGAGEAGAVDSATGHRTNNGGDNGGSGGFAWDPFPFVLLNLVLSAQSAFTAPVIIMAQRRQRDGDVQRAAELHFKVDYIRTEQLAALAARAERHAQLALVLQRQLSALLPRAAVSTSAIGSGCHAGGASALPVEAACSDAERE
jgi:uncharacterized membrane protein